MIGDWVKPDQCMIPTVYCRVEGIYPDGTVHLDKAERLCTLDELKPVILTPEILEKNEFDTSDPEVKQYRFTEDGQSYRFSLRQMYNQKDNKPNGYSFYAFGVLTIIDYVHQLQHALKLCGIEKEIIL